MTITHAYNAHDGTRIYRNRRGVDVAYAGRAEAISLLMTNPHWRDWGGFGSPTQADGLFLMVAPGYRPEEILLSPGPEGWWPMGRADIAEFCIDLIES